MHRETSNSVSASANTSAKDALTNLTQSTQCRYNIRSVVSPTLRGIPLLLFTKIIRFPILGRLILQLLKRKNDFGCVTRLAQSSELRYEMPLFYPLPDFELCEGCVNVQHGCNCWNCCFRKHDKLASDFDLKTFSEHDQQTAHTAISDYDASNDNYDSEDEFRHWTIQDYLHYYQTQQLTPYQVALAIIKAVKHSNNKSTTSTSPPLNAIVAMNEEDILEQARQSTKRYNNAINNTTKQKEELPRLLEGVPVVIKDEVGLKNYPTTQGTTFLASIDGISTKDCLVVQKLKHAGALIVGKSNMHEMGIGTTGFNWSDFGTARNPYNVHHYTGGSSSGSAAAVAAGFVPLAVGLDGGGSIRIPSSLCGVVGLKPTFSRGDMDMELCPTLGHIGPIGASVLDVAIGYAVMAGPFLDDDSNNSTNKKSPPVHLATFYNNQNLSDVKIGIYEEYFNDADAEIVETCWKVVKHLESLGAKVVKVSIPYLEETKMAHAITILTEMATGASRHYNSSIHKYTPETQINIELGRSIDSCEYLNAQKLRRYAMSILYENVFSKADVLFTPGTGCTAPEFLKSVERYGESNLVQTSNLMRFIYHGNLCGIPGVVVPVGYSHVGKLPISIQIQARHWDENLILRVAKSCEVFVVHKKPMVYHDILGLASKE